MKPSLWLLALTACEPGGSSPPGGDRGAGDTAGDAGGTETGASDTAGDSDSAAAPVGWVEVTNYTTELLDLVTLIMPDDGWIEWTGEPLTLTAGSASTLELPPGESWGLAFRTGDRCAFTPYFDVAEGGTTQAAVRYVEGVWSEQGGCEITD